MNLFKKLNKILNKIFPPKIDVNANIAVDGNKISEEDLDNLKRVAILSIKSANRFVLFVAEKNKDKSPRIVMHGIPQPMLLPILALIAETHKNILGQNSSVAQAKKLLNLS